MLVMAAFTFLLPFALAGNGDGNANAGSAVEPWAMPACEGQKVIKLDEVEVVTAAAPLATTTPTAGVHAGANAVEIIADLLEMGALWLTHEEKHSRPTGTSGQYSNETAVTIPIPNVVGEEDSAAAAAYTRRDLNANVPLYTNETTTVTNSNFNATVPVPDSFADLGPFTFISQTLTILQVETICVRFPTDANLGTCACLFEFDGAAPAALADEPAFVGTFCLAGLDAGNADLDEALAAADMYCPVIGPAVADGAPPEMVTVQDGCYTEEELLEVGTFRSKSKRDRVTAMDLLNEEKPIFEDDNVEDLLEMIKELERAGNISFDGTRPRARKGEY